MTKLTGLLVFLLTACVLSQGRGVADTSWSAYDLLKGSSLVVIGEVAIDYSANIPGGNLFTVTVAEVLAGSTGGGRKLHLISAHPTTGPSSPPSLFPQKHLLFLRPLTDADWLLLVATASGNIADLKRKNTFAITGVWKGAVSLHPSYSDSANQAIRRSYGISNPQQIEDALRQILSALSEKTTPQSDNPIATEFFQKFFTIPQPDSFPILPPTAAH